MKLQRFLLAITAGLAVSFSSIGSVSFAESVRVVRKGTQSSVNVPMNRAVVVESDVAFAELSIANPGIADISTLSDRTIYVLGKSPGLTTLTLLDEFGQLITNVDVRVAADVSEFKERLKQIMPNERIEVRTANDGIVLSGTVSNVDTIDQAMQLAERYAPDRVSNLMTVGGVQQVMLKVQFAEMQRSVSKSLGASLSARGTAGGGGLGLNIGSGAGITSGGSSLILGGDLPSASANKGAALFGFNMGSVEVGIMLEALEEKGMVRTLAEPNLTAISGQKAEFLAGGELPIPFVEDGSVEILFKKFGVQLAFTPTVLADQVINLVLETSVSAIDTANSYSFQNINIPAFKSRSSKTTVQMRDGESFAIAGLLKDDFRDSNGQVPFLGDLPILGALFRSAAYEREQSELVIIVTPHLVTPQRSGALDLPTDYVRPPSEKDLFLYGRTSNLTKFKGATGEVAKQEINSSYGYVLD